MNVLATQMGLFKGAVGTGCDTGWVYLALGKLLGGRMGFRTDTSASLTAPLTAPSVCPCPCESPFCRQGAWQARGNPGLYCIGRGCSLCFGCLGVADLSEAPGAAGPTMRVFSRQRAGPVWLNSFRAALLLSVAGPGLDEAGHGCAGSTPRAAAHEHCQPPLSAGTYARLVKAEVSTISLSSALAPAFHR